MSSDFHHFLVDILCVCSSELRCSYLLSLSIHVFCSGQIFHLLIYLVVDVTYFGVKRDGSFYSCMLLFKCNIDARWKSYGSMVGSQGNIGIG